MAVDIDDILQVIGQFGPYQRKIYFAMCIPILFVGAANLAYVFTAAQPNYRCFVPGCDKVSEPTYKTDFMRFTIPHINGSGTSYDSCHRYSRIPDRPEKSCAKKDFNMSLIEDCPNGKVFDDSVYTTTIVSEFNLTCKDSWKANSAQAVFFAGIMAGSVLFGFLSDWLGRKKTIMIGFVGTAASGIIIALVPHMTSFQIFKFLNGMMSSGVFQTAFILGLEFVGPSKRVMCGVIGEYFFALGEVMLGLIAWSIGRWRMIQLVISAPVSIFMLYWWVIPESVRWLQVQGREEEVVEVLDKIAKGNKKQIPLYMIRHQADNETASDDTPLLERNKIVSMKDIIKSPTMVFRTFAMIFIWIVTTLVYYGLSMNATDLGTGDTPSKPYVDFILTALVEIPGYTIAWVGMSLWGRKGTLCISLIFAGVSCAGSGLFQGKNLASVLVPALLGKCGITSAFAIIYLYTAELFPTGVRNSMLGVCSMFARVGGMLAPFSSVLSDIYKPLPMLVFGLLSLLGGLLSLTFPETLNSRLPDTISQAVHLGRSSMVLPISDPSTNHDEGRSLLQSDEELEN